MVLALAKPVRDHPPAGPNKRGENPRIGLAALGRNNRKLSAFVFHFLCDPDIGMSLASSWAPAVEDKGQTLTLPKLSFLNILYKIDRLFDLLIVYLLKVEYV